MAEHAGVNGQGRVVLAPTLADDHAVEMWTRTGSAVLARDETAVCIWLDGPRLRALAADLIERADYLDPTTTAAPTAETGATR
ncbi:hypothetical protein [Pseudonocardia sp. 73-21]|uniref:hypothetical protein n=1 Tax=Pseudonocardia sp. 73-21 TaxID=1895809 RepID=UPI002627AA17|nr:hypothetical protein [Pseudonocardia sp. 73-21]